MDENSFETWSYLTSGDQNPSPNEEEDFEEMKEKSGYPLTSNLQIEVGDHISGYKGKYWKSIDLEDKFPNVLSTAEFNSSPKEYFLTEDDDLNLTLSSMPNESFVTCLTGTQNLPHVKRDDCSGMKVEKHMVNRQNLSLGTQDLFTETSCLFIKREVIDKRYPNELMSGYQCRSRTADKVLNEEQGVHQSQNNNWAFFTTNVSDHELQSGSDRQPYFGSWPEGPHKFVCEQRPKKDRSCKQTCPASEEQSIKLISTLDGASGPGAILEIPIGEKLLVGNEDLSPPTETSDSSVETEKNIVRSCLPQLDIPNSALESTKNEKEKQKRIFNSAPNFNLLGQSHINIKEMEKCALIRENHEVSIILGEENDKTSEKNDKEENKQNNMTFNYHPPWFCLDIFKNSPLYIGGQLYSHNLSFNRPGQAVYFYKHPVPSLVLHYISSFWMVFFANKKTFLTFKSQTRVGNKIGDTGFSSSQILSGHPHTFSFLRINSVLHSLNEKSGEKLKRWEESKSIRCLPSKDSQYLMSTNFNSLQLLLPQEFAFQLVRIFGSPGVPIEFLLPDDYVIPLDWKILKMIYMQWKMSVERRQKAGLIRGLLEVEQIKERLGRST